MSGTLYVFWTIVSAGPPRPLLHCSRCGRERGFVSSGRFRLNASGKRLDAWLVYRCGVCENSFNRPVFERRKSGEIEPGLIEALHRNDPELARRVAFDLAGRWANGFEAASGTAIVKRPLPPAPDEAARLVIRIAGAVPAGMRADRLIAQGLGLPRGEMRALVGADRKALKRPPRDGMSIAVDLSGRADARAIARRAAGENEEDEEAD